MRNKLDLHIIEKWCAHGLVGSDEWIGKFMNEFLETHSGWWKQRRQVLDRVLLIGYATTTEPA